MTTTAPALHIYFLLDRSGSMDSMASDVIGGFNGFLGKQQREGADAVMTLVQFDSRDPHEVLTDAMPISAVRPLSAQTFQPRGGTPLYDAMGHIIADAKIRAEQLRGGHSAAEEIMVVTFTDGHENQSVEYSRQKISELIAKRTESGWTFVYLGANQDSYAEGGQIGYTAASTQNFAADAAGNAAVFESLNVAVIKRRRNCAPGSSTTGATCSKTTRALRTTSAAAAATPRDRATDRRSSAPHTELTMSVSDAHELATRIHEGLVDKAGQPYIHHVRRVMARLDDPDEKMVAALHDVVEDTGTSLADLAVLGCPPRIITAVDAITRRQAEDYDSFIQRVSENPLARAVKAADLCDNSDEARLERLPAEDAAKLRSKYATAIRLLGVGGLIDRWRAEDRAGRLVTDAVVTLEPEKMVAVREQALADVAFACSGCDQTAGRLILVPGWLTREGFLGTCGFRVKSPEPLESLRLAIQTRDLPAVRGIDTEFAPFWCPSCERVWCQAHWITEVTFDEGFYDATYGTCPSGHQQKLDD